MNTWSIVDGDVSISNGTFTTITGQDKVSQDIEIAVLTPWASNKFHPRFGSVFDNFIGTPANPGTNALIINELSRVIQNYIKVQVAKMQAAANSGLANPYSQAEIVSNIGTITVTQNLNQFTVSGSVTTLAGTQIPVTSTTSA